ncbi:hypothetical protein AAVH_30542 [Aphelenchoides avenae]|nr:hypothetical protein AAVH_30542 [Aphelenchus avenae]
MLLPEVLLEILHCLERDDLDVLQLCSVGLRDVIDNDPNGVLRPFDGYVMVYDEGMGQVYHLEHESYYYSEEPVRTAQELAARLRNGRIPGIYFEAGTEMTSELVEALVPVRDAFRNASVGLPFFYDDNMIVRCLTEVFFCKEIDILGNHHDPASCPGGIDDVSVFFRLPCVLACQKLTLLKNVEAYDLNPDDVVVWLHTAVEYGPKELHCYKKFFFGIRKNFASLLVETFNAATEPCSYKIVVYEDHAGPGIAPREHSNVRTRENLRFQRVNADLQWQDNYNKPSFVVERGPMP